MEYIKFKDKVDFVNRIVENYGFKEVRFFEVYETINKPHRLRLTITDGTLFYASDIHIDCVGSNGTRQFGSLAELESIIRRIYKFYCKTLKIN